MGNTIVLDEGSLAIKEEVTEGTYVEESEAASFIEVLAEGFEIVPSREVLERNLRTATVESDAPRVGMKSVSGTIPVELKAGASAGAAPRQDLLLKALLGGKRSSSAITSQTGHTNTVLEIDDTNGTEQVDTLTCEAKADTDNGDFFIVKDEKTGLAWAIAMDLTGSGAEPTSSKWREIPSARKAQVDISGATTAADVAALVETAFDALTSVTILTDDTAADGTMLFTRAAAGAVTDAYGRSIEGTEDYAAASEVDGSSGLTWAATTPGVNDDIDNLRVGDILLVKESGAHHLSPIISKDADSITLLVGLSGGGNFSDSVVIEAFTTYYHDTAYAPTLSLTSYIGSKIREKVLGARVSSAEMSGYTTGTTLEMAYAFEGLDFAREVGAPLYTPSFDSILPPVALNATIYKDGVAVCSNELTISITNTLGFKTCTSSDNGKEESRITKQDIAGTVNPYMEDDDVDIFNDLFRDGGSFSIFAHAQIDASTSGEYENIVGFYLPTCKLPEIATGDQEGLATDAMSFTAHRDSGHDSIFIGMI